MDKEKLARFDHFFASAKLPQSIVLGPGEIISDLPKFLHSHFTALKSNCPNVLQVPYTARLNKLQVLLSKPE